MHPYSKSPLPAQAVQDGKGKKRKPPRGTPALWRHPGDASRLDLFLGPGGEAMRPDLSRLTFIEEEILAVSGRRGAELRYVVSDLGATFGKTGGQNGPIALLRQVKGSRNEPEDYAGDRFVEGVEGGA